MATENDRNELDPGEGGPLVPPSEDSKYDKPPELAELPGMLAGSATGGDSSLSSPTSEDADVERSTKTDSSDPDSSDAVFTDDLNFTGDLNSPDGISPSSDSEKTGRSYEPGPADRSVSKNPARAKTSGDRTSPANSTAAAVGDRTETKPSMPSNINEILEQSAFDPAPETTTSEASTTETPTVSTTPKTALEPNRVKSEPPGPLVTPQKAPSAAAQPSESNPQDARKVAKAVRASMTFNPDTGETKAIPSKVVPLKDAAGNDSAKKSAIPKVKGDVSAQASEKIEDNATAAFASRVAPTQVQKVPSPVGGPKAYSPASPNVSGLAGPTAPVSKKPTLKPPLAVIEKKEGDKKKFAFLLIPVLLIAVFFGAWAIDENSRGDRVARNTEINGVDISSQQGEKLSGTINEATAQALEAPLTVRANGGEIVTTPRDLGAATNTDATIKAALEARRSGFVLVRPFSWASSFLRTDQISAEFEVDPTAAAAATQTTFETIIDPVVETGIEVDGDRFRVVEGKRGQSIDPKEIEAELPGALDGITQPTLELTPVDGIPKISTVEAQNVASDATEALVEPIEVQLLDERITVEPASLRKMVVLDSTNGEATWSISDELAVEELEGQFGSVGVDGDEARFAIVNEKPIVVPTSSAVKCCDDTTAERIKEGIVDRRAEGDFVVLEPKYVAEDPSADKLNALGITEEVSSFTTPHAAGGNRVKNIQRFADLIRGQIIPVGKELSLNEAVGRRTLRKGFFADGAINQGVIEDQVGGGISQFATTFFNASFFSGIEIKDYQFHTLAIGSRYPVGRESTISWPAPNVRVKNTSEHPILVWTSYTRNSITVTFYSQKHLKVTDVNGNELGSDVYAPGRDKTFPPEITSDRSCKVYTTRRNTTFPDGEVVKDSFTGFYRPGEGKDCDGNLTPKAQAEKDKRDAEAAEEEEN